MKTLPILLKKHRQNAGLTQREVAEALQVTLYTYKSYEAGRRVPPLEMALKISDVFEITLDELVGR
ncbi:MAG: helix-turn-helix transcriptional regulator [Firmicutes bacterium]|nr:helix-turn-helix transcriptional regulator [Bacillota bacterium]